MLKSLRGGVLRLIKRSPPVFASAVASIAVGTGLMMLVVMALRQSAWKPSLARPGTAVQILASGSVYCATCPDLLAVTVVDRWRTHRPPALAAIGAYRQSETMLAGTETGTTVHLAHIRGDYWNALGVAASSGRLIDGNDPNDDASAVVNERFALSRGWSKSLPREGRRLIVGGRLVRVVGIVPDGVLVPNTDLWVSDHFLPAAEPAGALAYAVVGMMTRDATLLDVRQQLLQVGVGEYEAAGQGGRFGVRIDLVADLVRAAPGPALTLLIAAAIAALVLATTNVQSLLILRALDGSRDMAVRLALGAGRRQLIASLGRECLVIALAATLPAFVLVAGGSRLLAPYLAAQWSRPVLLTLDSWSLAVLAALPLAMASLGLAGQAWHVWRFEFHLAIRGTDSASFSGGGRMNLRSAFIGVQIALAVLAVGASALLLRAYRSSASIPIGYHPERLVVAPLDLSNSPTAGWNLATDLGNAVVADLAEAGLSRSAYWVASSPSGVVRPGDPWTTIEGHGSPRGLRQVIAEYHVSPGFFETAGLHAEMGRLFGPADRAGSLPVVIVNRFAADHYWPGESPLGRRIKMGPESSALPWLTVVGVVPTTQRFDESALQISSAHPTLAFAMVFVPFGQSQVGATGVPIGLTHVFVGAASDDNPTPAIAAMSATFQRFESQVATPRIATLQDLQWQASPFPDVAAAGGLLATLAAGSLLLAAIGIFSTLAEQVRWRRHELGVRRALGGTATDIARVVSRRAVLVLGAGTAAGVLTAIVFRTGLQAVLFGASGRYSGLLLSVDPRDPIAAGLTGILLFLAAVAGLALPLRRALAIEPMEALRQL